MGVSFVGLLTVVVLRLKECVLLETEPQEDFGASTLRGNDVNDTKGNLELTTLGQRHFHGGPFPVDGSSALYSEGKSEWGRYSNGRDGGKDGEIPESACPQTREAAGRCCRYRGEKRRRGGNALLLELGFNEALCNKPADQGKRGTFSGAMCLEEGEGMVVHGGVTCPLVLLWVTWRLRGGGVAFLTVAPR